MKSTRIYGPGPATWVLVFQTGDEVLGELRRFAAEHKLGGSHLSAVGAFQSVVLGYFDWQSKEYRRNPLDEQVEVANLSGFITEGGGGPMVHAHVTVGRSDGSACAGHLLEGRVRPTLELLIEESPRHLKRRVDPQSGLPLIDPSA